MPDPRDILISTGGRPVVIEKLRRELAFLTWLEKQPYCDEHPLGIELRKTATLHRIALRNVITDICPEWSDKGGAKQKHQR